MKKGERGLQIKRNTKREGPEVAKNLMCLQTEERSVDLDCSTQQ